MCKCFLTTSTRHEGKDKCRRIHDFLSAACIFLVWYWGAARVQYKTWYSHELKKQHFNQSTAATTHLDWSNTSFQQSFDALCDFNASWEGCTRKTVFVLLSDFYCVLRTNICFWFSVIQCWTWNRLYASMCFHRHERKVSECSTHAKYRRVSYDRNQQVSSTKLS